MDTDRRLDDTCEIGMRADEPGTRVGQGCEGSRPESLYGRIAAMGRRLSSTARRFVSAVAVAAVIVAFIATSAAWSEAGERGGRRTIEVDVAENGTRFLPDETPVFEDGLPNYGAEFITEGYIYPAGTLSGANGTLPDGSPEFPDKVIGRWTCRGWHVGEGARTTAGPLVVTHQIFDFGEAPGSEAIMTDGFEYAEPNVAFHRAIIGGTGRFARARGEQVQTLLGYPNPSHGVSIRVVLEVSK